MTEARMTAEARAKEPRQAAQPHDATSLSTADDRIRLSEWLPPQEGVAPLIRLGSRWINVLWAVPLVVVLGIIGIAVCQQLRTMPGVQAFIARYPGGTPSSAAVYSGFPLWLRLLHFFNFFLMMFIIRAGIQILADHPRLYWRRDCTPGTDWFRFQHEVPKDRVWTSKDDSVTIPKWLGVPGVRHSIGFAVHDQACPAGSKDRPNLGRPPDGYRRMGRPEDPIRGPGDLVVFVAQWHTTELC